MPQIRIDSEISSRLSAGLLRLRRQHKGKMAAASPNDVVRIWLGLDPPRLGVKCLSLGAVGVGTNPRLTRDLPKRFLPRTKTSQRGRKQCE